MAWMWGNAGVNLQSWKLYGAVNSGSDIFKGVDCDETYPVSPPNSCKIFEWQADKMSLSFDDKELPKATTKQEDSQGEEPPKHEEL